MQKYLAAFVCIFIGGCSPIDKDSCHTSEVETSYTQTSQAMPEDVSAIMSRLGAEAVSVECHTPAPTPYTPANVIIMRRDGYTIIADMDRRSVASKSQIRMIEKFARTQCHMGR